MIICEKLDEYRKMKLWINELPGDNPVVVSEKTIEYKANRQIHWFEGILCLELRTAPRVASNYAMPSDVVRAGLPKEYNAALVDLFDKLAAENIFPSGTLEILGGRHGDVGSSYIAFQTVLKILIALFEQNEKLSHIDIPSIVLAGCCKKMVKGDEIHEKILVSSN